MPEHLEIKPMATDDEIRGKAFVHWRAWHAAYPGLVSPEYLDRLTLEKCESLAFRWRDRLLVAKDRGRVVGFVGYGDRGAEAPETGEIFALYVLPEYWGQGIGRRLLEAGLERLSGYARVCLWVLKENRRAIRFYRRCGFVPDGEEVFSPVVQAAEIRMIREKGTGLHDTEMIRRNTMEIKAVKFRTDGFYTQPFAFGGEEGMDRFDRDVRYRGSLQNYLIDTGDEVILVDTGLPAGTPEEKPDENSLAYTGKDICGYMEAFAALGYRPEQVTAILLTHRHSDHSGELKSFPGAKIYVNEAELGAAELQGIPNIVPVSFTDGPYYNFPESQKIRDGIYYIKAKGHTNGNSIVIVEKDGRFYMIHGDLTYVDEALYADKLSVVFDDLAAARETQDRVIDFIRSHPTVYMGTHTPQGYENLEADRVMDLDHPVPTVLAEVDFTKQEFSGRYVCSICGYIYDPAEHDGAAFEDLPDDWRCPRCRQGKAKFNRA